MGIAPLSAEEQQVLLGLARRAIAHRLRLSTFPGRDDLSAATLPARLEETGAAFVTLMERGELRGCIGQIAPTGPLWESVVENAIHAGWDDPRFSSLSHDELSRLSIEITVLGPLEPVTGASEVEIGKHGIVIETADHRGVFLPQVASERGWTAEEFLEHLCRKAHLPVNAWRRPGAFLWRFEAEHFAEHERS